MLHPQPDVALVPPGGVGEDAGVLAGVPGQDVLVPLPGLAGEVEAGDESDGLVSVAGQGRVVDGVEELLGLSNPPTLEDPVDVRSGLGPGLAGERESGPPSW